MNKKTLLIVACVLLIVFILLGLYIIPTSTTPPEPLEYEYRDGIRLTTDSVDIRVDPIVNLSYRDIPYLSSGSPGSDVNWMKNHQAFDENYSANDLSIILRDSIVRKMMTIAETNGENSTVLLKAVYVCYYNWTERPNMIPCYAERANFNGTEIWAIAFNRGIGFEGSISHEDLYFISIPQIEKDSFIESPSDAILYWFGSD